jgi:DNA polymerase III epsilon subunit-like protein
VNKTLFYFDTETSGLESTRHTILQIAWIIEKNGAVMCERVFDIRPKDDADMCLAALNVNNFTIARMLAAREAPLVLGQMREDIKLAVGGGSALTPVGHNVKFDIDFLYALAKSRNETWWLNFGNNDYLKLKKPLCTVAMCHWLDYTGVLSQSDYKLTSCCKQLGITLEGAHDALQDVRATRQLFHKLEGLMRPIREVL